MITLTVIFFVVAMAAYSWTTIVNATLGHPAKENKIFKSLVRDLEIDEKMIPTEQERYRGIRRLLLAALIAVAIDYFPQVKGIFSENFPYTTELVLTMFKFPLIVFEEALNGELIENIKSFNIADCSGFEAIYMYAICYMYLFEICAFPFLTAIHEDFANTKARDCNTQKFSNGMPKSPKCNKKEEFIDI